MADNERVPSIGEVLEVLATYRIQLVEERGEQKVKNLPISDEWGAGRTAMTLILQNPGKWDYLLDNEETRDGAYKIALSFLQETADEA